MLRCDRWAVVPPTRMNDLCHGKPAGRRAAHTHVQILRGDPVDRPVIHTMNQLARCRPDCETWRLNTCNGCCIVGDGSTPRSHTYATWCAGTQWANMPTKHSCNVLRRDRVDRLCVNDTGSWTNYKTQAPVRRVWQ